jgi:uncharacterized repeat protein (TIGR01451 family)/CSLREA domain-containing protein
VQCVLHRSVAATVLQDESEGRMSHLRGWLTLITLVGALAWAESAQAVVFTVDAFFDAVDETPGDGVCATASYRPVGRACTLRAAIQEANALGGAHTIVLPSGTYTLSLLTGDYYVDATSDASGSLKIFADVTLSGAGAFTTAIDANHLYRVLQVHGTASISGVTIQHGRIDPAASIGEYGGGIVNFGTLDLTASRIRQNAAGRGGGISNDGDMTLTSVLVGDNSAAVAGGIDNDGSLTLTNSSVAFNTAEESAGGIYNLGTVTLTQSDVLHNIAYGNDGGGILNNNTVVVDHSTVARNTAGHSGGGIISYGLGTSSFFGLLFYGDAPFDSAVVTITHSTISKNAGFSGAGGGIANGGTVTLDNSTVSGNGVEQQGGGIANAGAMTVTNSTIAHNVAYPSTGTGGGLFTFGPYKDGAEVPTSVLRNTIVANNSDDDCDGDPLTSVTSLGHNLDSDGTCALSNIGDLSDVSPFLGPLALNGGVTLTHALLAGSPAIDTGDNAACPADDQRGVARPQGPACDIGAYERVPGEPRNTSNLSIAISADRPRASQGGALKYTVTVTNMGPGDAAGVSVLDRLPPDVAVAAVRSSQGACTVSPQRHKSTVTCALGALAARGAATVTLDVTPERPGMLVNTAVVTGDVSDPDLRNNRATVKTEVR